MAGGARAGTKGRDLKFRVPSEMSAMIGIRLRGSLGPLSLSTTLYILRVSEPYNYILRVGLATLEAMSWSMLNFTAFSLIL